MSAASRRAAGPALVLTLATLLSACGGGFSSAPPSPPDDTIHSYVALGDTFTAAPGIGSTTGDDGCERSDANYPALAAQELGVKDVHDVSCAGVTSGALTTDTKPGDDTSSVPPQVQAIGRHTDLVTIGIGLADRDIVPHAFAICTALPCIDKVQPQDVLDDIDAMAGSLTAAVRTIQDKAPNAYIVLVGYPKITPDTGGCDALPKLDQPALDAANQVLDSVNREIRAAARDTGVAFLDVAALSVGHELCSGDPWVEARTGKHAAPTDFRPLAAEQKAVAGALADLVRTR